MSNTDEKAGARYPTIERLADLSQTTVGYQADVLIVEAVECLRELAAKTEELRVAISRNADLVSANQTMDKALEEHSLLCCKRAESAEQSLSRAREEALREWSEKLEFEAADYLARGFTDDHYVVAVRKEIALKMRCALALPRRSPTNEEIIKGGVAFIMGPNDDEGTQMRVDTAPSTTPGREGEMGE